MIPFLFSPSWVLVLVGYTIIWFHYTTLTTSSRRLEVSGHTGSPVLMLQQHATCFDKNIMIVAKLALDPATKEKLRKREIDHNIWHTGPDEGATLADGNASENVAVAFPDSDVLGFSPVCRWLAEQNRRVLEDRAGGGSGGGLSCFLVVLLSVVGVVGFGLAVFGVFYFSACRGRGGEGGRSSASDQEEPRAAFLDETDRQTDRLAVVDRTIGGGQAGEGRWTGDRRLVDW